MPEGGHEVRCWKTGREILIKVKSDLGLKEDIFEDIDNLRTETLRIMRVNYGLYLQLQQIIENRIENHYLKNLTLDVIIAGVESTEQSVISLKESENNSNSLKSGSDKSEGIVLSLETTNAIISPNSIKDNRGTGLQESSILSNGSEGSLHKSIYTAKEAHEFNSAKNNDRGNSGKLDGSLVSLRESVGIKSDGKDASDFRKYVEFLERGGYGIKSAKVTGGSFDIESHDKDQEKGCKADTISLESPTRDNRVIQSSASSENKGLLAKKPLLEGHIRGPGDIGADENQSTSETKVSCKEPSHRRITLFRDSSGKYKHKNREIFLRPGLVGKTAMSCGPIIHDDSSVLNALGGEEWNGPHIRLGVLKRSLDYKIHNPTEETDMHSTERRINSSYDTSNGKRDVRTGQMRYGKIIHCTGKNKVTPNERGYIESLRSGDGGSQWLR